MQELVCNSREEFLERIRKAQIIIVHVDTSLSIWKEFVCSIGDLHLRLIRYGNKGVIEVLAVDTFKKYWTQVPDRKYYFIMKSPDGHEVVAPATDDKAAEKLLEDWIYNRYTK